jgi:hypothetical protein
MWAKAALYLKRGQTILVASPIEVGYLLSVLWLILLAIYIGGKGWTGLWGLGFADAGNFLAGAFAPLAFFWLVIAVLLQTAELGLQREELRQSREALELQAAETRALVEQNKLSLEVSNKSLAQQQLREREARLHQTIDALGFKIVSLADHSQVSVSNGGTRPVFGTQRYLREQAAAGGGRDAVFPAALKQIVDCIFHVERVKQQTPGAIARGSPSLAEEVQLLLTRFQAITTILEKEPELETVRARAYALDLEAFPNALQDVLTVVEQGLHS